MADRYWVGGTGTWNTTSTTNWSASSGGASGASVPTVADNVFFDQASTYTVTMTGALACLDITVSAGTVTFASGTSPTLDVRGSMSLLAGTVWNATAPISFSSTATGKTITTNGVTIKGSISFGGAGGAWSLGSSLTMGSSRIVTFGQGTLDLNNFSITTDRFDLSGTLTRTLNFNTTGIIYLTGTGNVFVATSTTGLTLSGSREIRVTYSGAVGVNVRTIQSTTAARTCNFFFTGGTYSLTLIEAINGGAYNNLDFTGFSGTVVGNGGTGYVYGNLVLSSGMTVASGSGRIIFGFSGTNQTKTITSNGRTINRPIYFSTSSITNTFIIQDALTLGATLLAEYDGGVLDLNGKTITVGSFSIIGAISKSLTFNGGSLVCASGSTTAFNITGSNFSTVAGTGVGQISMTAATAKTFVGAGRTFNCTLNQGGAGDLTITGSNTFNNISNTVQPASVLFTAGTTTTFLSAFSLSGTSGNLITIGSSTSASHTLSKLTGTVSVSFCSINNSSATGGATWEAFLSNGNVNAGGNTGWMFSPAAPSNGNFLMFF